MLEAWVVDLLNLVVGVFWLLVVGFWFVEFGFMVSGRLQFRVM